MKAFSEIPVSTQTIIVRTSINTINLEMCHSDLLTSRQFSTGALYNIRYGSSSQPPSTTTTPPHSAWTEQRSVAKKRRQHDHSLRDADESMTPSPSAMKQRTFLNCITLAVRDGSVVGGGDDGQTPQNACRKRAICKGVSVKIFHNGVFQLTGCRSVPKARLALHTLLDAILPSESITIQTPGSSGGGGGKRIVTYYLESAMRNVDFSLGFPIDRIRLGNYAERFTPYTVPPMTSGYMGVKIRIAVHDIDHVPVMKSSYPSGSDVEYVSYGDLFRHVYPGNERRLAKRRFVSMSVFQNGKVLMSGMHACVQEPCYLWLVRFTHSIRDLIESKPRSASSSVKRTFKRTVQDGDVVVLTKTKKRRAQQRR